MSCEALEIPAPYPDIASIGARNGARCPSDPLEAFYG